MARDCSGRCSVFGVLRSMTDEPARLQRYAPVFLNTETLNPEHFNNYDGNL